VRRRIGRLSRCGRCGRGVRRRAGGRGRLRRALRQGRRRRSCGRGRRRVLGSTPDTGGRGLVHDRGAVDLWGGRVPGRGAGRGRRRGFMPGSGVPTRFFGRGSRVGRRLSGVLRRCVRCVLRARLPNVPHRHDVRGLGVMRSPRSNRHAPRSQHSRERPRPSLRPDRQAAGKECHSENGHARGIGGRDSDRVAAVTSYWR